MAWDTTSAREWLARAARIGHVRAGSSAEGRVVLGGQLTIQLRDRNVVPAARELFVVPRGVERCPRAGTETALVLLEPSGVVNTAMPAGNGTPRPVAYLSALIKPADVQVERVSRERLS